VLGLVSETHSHIYYSQSQEEEYAQMAQIQYSTTTTPIKPFTSKFPPFGHVKDGSEETVWEKGKNVSFSKGLVRTFPPFDLVMLQFNVMFLI